MSMIAWEFLWFLSLPISFGLYSLFSFLFKKDSSIFFLIFAFTSTSVFAFTSNLIAESALGVFWGMSVVFSLGIFNWIYFPDLLLKEMSLSGVNKILALYLILLEMVSASSKGLTLGLRISANLMAGKLIGALCVMGSSWVFLSPFFVMMESAVSLIQAFIFILLSSMYWTDSLLR